MTMMTPIDPTADTAIRHPEADRADLLVACSAVTGDMMAEAARVLDLAASLPRDVRSGLHHQSRMRLTGVVMLLAELDSRGEDACHTIIDEIADISDTTDPDLIRDMAERLHRTINVKLRQIRLRMSYDRYA